MTDTNEREELNGGELVYRATDPAVMKFRDAGDSGAGAILEGRMLPYGEWTEVNSLVEGHFMERFLPGSLAKTMKERAARIRVLFEHGLDILGRQSIASVDGFDDREDGAYYEATLLRSVPDLIVDGLRAGLYGASIRFRPIKGDRNRSPEPSDHNPDGIPEVTYREAELREFSVVTFPQYEGATASVRSITDELATRQLMADPTRLLELVRYVETLKANAGTAVADTTSVSTEPQHSGRQEPEDPDPRRSRSTQARDYLNPEEGAPEWRL